MTNTELKERTEIVDPPPTRESWTDPICQLAYAFCNPGSVDGFATLKDNAQFHARQSKGEVVQCVLIDKATFDELVKRIQ